MRFAVSLIRLLCAVVAGAILVAFLYLINQGAEYHTAAMVCMVLFIAALSVWALIAVIGDGWLRKVSDNSFYQKISAQPEVKEIKAVIPEEMSNLVAKINENAEANYQSIYQSMLNEFQALNEKVALMGENEKMSEGAENVCADEIQVITENMQKLQTQFDGLQNMVKEQFRSLENLLQRSGQWETAPKVYPKLTEEAAYPESVIDYAQETNEPQNDGVKAENLDEPEYQTIEPEVEENEDSAFEDQPLDNFLEETADANNENESDVKVQETTDENLSDNSVAEMVDNQIDLGADDPFGTATNLTPAEDVDIVTAQEADDALDLGADDPFGAKVENSPEVHFEPTFEPEHHTMDLGADDPFGAKVEDSPEVHFEPTFEPEHHTIDLGADDPFGASLGMDNPVDVSAIEPAASVKKNEPNLDHIFNDELASELADLEILNDKKDDEKEDLDLEQFFAGHRKSLG